MVLLIGKYAELDGQYEALNTTMGDLKTDIEVLNEQNEAKDRTIQVLNETIYMMQHIPQSKLLCGGNMKLRWFTIFKKHL